MFGGVRVGVGCSIIAVETSSSTRDTYIEHQHQHLVQSVAVLVFSLATKLMVKFTPRSIASNANKGMSDGTVTGSGSEKKVACNIFHLGTGHY